MTTAPPPTAFLHIVVGYDGSPPASRALDTAVRLLQGRTGVIVVAYVAHLSSLTMLSPDAIGEMEKDFDDIERELRAQAAEQLRAHEMPWEFQRLQGAIVDQLVAAALDLHQVVDPYQFNIIFAVIAGLFLFELLGQRKPVWKMIDSQSRWLRWSAYYAFGLAFIALVLLNPEHQAQPFIYFQF